MRNTGTADNQMPLLDNDLNVPVSHIYKIKKEALQQFFDTSNPDQQMFAEDMLEKHGRVAGILRKLSSGADTGIVGDEKDLQRRQRVFGENKQPVPPRASLKESICQTIQNLLWVVIGATALLSSLVSLFFAEWKSVWEGLSIIIVALFLISIIVFTDYFKDQKYIELSGNIKKENVPVVRGKLGATQSISVWDVVVGDVVLLETGASVPADCLIITAQDLQIDEPEHFDEQGNSLSNPDLNKNEQDPVLLAGSIIKKGQCKAVVCAVGEYSSRGIIDKKLDTDKDTPLQTKLKNLEGTFMKFAFFACIIVLILVVVMLIVKLAGDEPWYKVLFQQSLRYANLVVVLFVVVVPEGLPLTIGVSLAYTTDKMYQDDKILVKELDAPEKMGAVNELLVGKTSTITTGEMKMAQFLCEEKQIKNTRKNTLLNCDLSPITFELIKESILFNCSARIEMDDVQYQPVGNATEVGLLKFLRDAEIPVHLLIQQKLGKVRMVSPFNSIKKRSATVLTNPNKPGTVSVYIKGAPEVIIEMCKTIQSANGIVQLSPELAEEIKREVDSMASKPLRVISFAYIEMDEKVWQMQFENTGKEFEQALDENIIQFTFLGAFGMKDPLRKNVKSVVNAVKQKGYVNVRMISGDHYETAKRVAIKAGILTESDLERQNCVIDAEDFRTMVGAIQDNVDGLQLEMQENFQSVLEDCKVICRANSIDKLLMVVGLKNEGRMVAVTGDGINDVEALENADVGIAMGTGCSAAKQVSDLILSDDDFESAIRAIMWGRNIYHNVGRFLQFQLTVNISVLFLVNFGIVFFGESPLNPVQLLWINLIMDTFAAIALSTEPPLEKILKRPPTNNTQILTPQIWRQVIGVSMWNSIIILTLYMFGPYIAGLESFRYYGDKIATISPDEGCDDLTQIAALKAMTPPTLADKCQPYWGGQMKLKLFTYVFNVFVFMQVFNYINCRKIGQSELNVFEKMFSKFNKYFWIIIAFVSIGQYAMVQWFSILTRTTPLARSEWGACFVSGISVLLIAAILKYTGPGLLQKISGKTDKLVDENKNSQDQITESIAKLNNTEVKINTDFLKGKGNKGKGKKTKEPDEDLDDDNYQNYQNMNGV